MAAAREAKKERKELRDGIKRVASFFKPMGKPAKYDWLATHNEPGQTFEEYLDAEPRRPTADRQTVYVMPMGQFSEKQQKAIDAAAAYLEIFYDVPVQRLPPRLVNPTGSNLRLNKLTRTRQVRTGHVLADVLKPALPSDAAALIAFTADDLYPDSSKSYVFGQASLEDRVGVWSLARLDDNTDERGFFVRTLKIAAHETGHMFSMRHCTKYECLMSGTNHLGETDRRPIDACPECTAKICWLSDVDQVERYERLAVFFQNNGMEQEANEFRRKAAAIGRVETGSL